MSELVVKDKFIYSLADKQFYEVLTRYAANTGDFCIGLKRRLPEDWVLRRHELWMHCTPPVTDYPDQGWKIHLSATPAHAPAILMTAADVLFEAGVPFKFVADKLLLGLSLGKRWARGGGGKFIAIYPRDEQQCAELLEKLHQATIGFNGPYILSDKRYQESRVVFYRYGGLRSTRRISANGTTELVITGQDGQYIADERTPYFSLPAGIVDPFDKADAPDDAGEPGTLKKGRYKIDSSLAFSNSGGVYLALDRETGRTVIIKEARPFTNVSIRGLDAVQLLKKEHRVLCCIQDLDIAPRPYDFFFDWEHAYLVESYLEDARDFRSYMGGVSLALRTRPSQADSQEFLARYCDIFIQLAEVLQALHRKDIVFGDLSMANVLVSKNDAGDGIKVRLIDFEGSHESNVDLAAHLFTPGYSSEEFVERGVTEASDDLYALGSLMLAGLFPMNQLLGLDRSAHRRFLAALSADFGLPVPICTIIERLLSKKDLRPTLAEVIAVLDKDYRMPEPVITVALTESGDLHAHLARIMQYIDTTADFNRLDRLYPADPEIFSANPLSLAYGACGVALVQHKVRGSVAPEVMDWIKQFPLRREAYAPGLYSGLSGIAWFFLETGEEQRAIEALALASAHPYLHRFADVFHGTAGWGMTQLRFHRHFGDPTYLDAAIRAGEHLLAQREEAGDGQCLWRTPDGLSAGFAHGGAGICTFLLYLYLATDRKAFLQAGEQGMAWVMAQGIRNMDGGLTWVVRDRTPSTTPYWRWGSSGIARALLRYWHVTGNEAYAAQIDDVIIDADRKYAIFPGYFFGLAGIGELFLDLSRFPRWRAPASSGIKRLLEGSNLYALTLEGGIAFPGESLGRICCDLGTGGAGVALVLHRYLRRDGASLMLDELLPGWPRRDGA